MFNITLNDINAIRKDYGIASQAVDFTELQRYYCEKHETGSKEARLIVKVEFDGTKPIVVRFRNERDVTLELVEKQSRFAALLGENGMETPTLYKAEDCYAKWYSINGYDVIVTVEQFVNGELRCVDVYTAFETGRLLAKMHNVAEKADFHVKNAVLFNPFTDNDLFTFSAFKEHEKELAAIDACLYWEVVKKYEECMQKLMPIQSEAQYAVQGDISNCNLYRSAQGEIGIFDFNRCGDNYLYCDAVMQAAFEARLMDYPIGHAKDYEERILSAFLRGYQLERPFTDSQREMFPYLYAIINAFWSADIKWNSDSLLKELERGDMESVHNWLWEIHMRIYSKKHASIY